MKNPIPMMTRRVSGALCMRRNNVPQRASARDARADITAAYRRSQITLAAEQPRVVHMCKTLDSCPDATCGTALYAGSGCVACDRKQLPRPALAAVAPTKDLFPGSSGSARLASDAPLPLARFRFRPTLSMDGWKKRLF